MQLRNVIYYHNIIALGGTTTHALELIKKYYEKKDITLIYKYDDGNRIGEFRKYVRCIKLEPKEEIECETLFIDYEGHENLKQFKAKKYYQIIHAMYKTNKITPKTNDLFDKYICVSDIVKKEYQELTGLPDSKFIVSRNPLTINDNEKTQPIIIGSFTRLSWEKGKARMERLIQKLDLEHVNYLWLIFTNSLETFYSKNVIKLQPRNDIRNIIAMCDIVAQLSDCEGDCYAIKEAKAIMDKVLITPIESFFEMGCTKEQDIILDFDMKNIDQVVAKIKALKHKPRQSKFIPKEDRYNELLIDSISDYKGGKNMKFTVKALPKFENIVDSQIGKTRKAGEEWEVTEERKDILVSANLVTVIGQVPQAQAQEVKTETKPKKTVRKAVRKTK